MFTLVEGIFSVVARSVSVYPKDEEYLEIPRWTLGCMLCGLQLLEFSISISSVKFNSVSSYMGFYLFICSLICLSNVIASIVFVLKTIIFLSFFFLFFFSLSFFLSFFLSFLIWQIYSFIGNTHKKCVLLQTSHILSQACSSLTLATFTWTLLLPLEWIHSDWRIRT